MLRNTITALALCCPLAAAAAQSDVRPDHKHAWAENVGWTNWRDAGDPDASEGVRLHDTYLAGSAWGENTGWLGLGDGSPADGHTYANLDGADCGVNLDPDTGMLSGMAWAENVGWINFSGGALADPPQPARLDLDAYRLRGFAWGENIGWINLDHETHYAAFYCPADFNRDTLVDTRDVLAYLNAWTAGDPRADFDDNGVLDTRDVLAFLNAWNRGC